VARPNDDNDDYFDLLSEVADRAKLTGRNRAKFLDDFMDAGGYESVQSRDSYRRREETEDNGRGGGSGYFTRGRRERGRREEEDDRF
jgi:hypothetical protein